MAKKSIDSGRTSFEGFARHPVGMAESDDIKSAITTLKKSCETAPACAVKIDSIHTHTSPIHGKKKLKTEAA